MSLLCTVSSILHDTVVVMFSILHDNNTLLYIFIIKHAGHVFLKNHISHVKRFSAAGFSVINGCGRHYQGDFYGIFTQLGRSVKRPSFTEVPIIEALIITKCR